MSTLSGGFLHTHREVMPKGSPTDADNSTSPTRSVCQQHLPTVFHHPDLPICQSRLRPFISLRNSIRLLAKICMPLPQSQLQLPVLSRRSRSRALGPALEHQTTTTEQGRPEDISPCYPVCCVHVGWYQQLPYVEIFIIPARYQQHV